MSAREHNCEKCGGYLELFYNGWTCSVCRRRYLIQGGQITEMWWKNQHLAEEDENEAEVVIVDQYAVELSNRHGAQVMPL